MILAQPKTVQNERPSGIGVRTAAVKAYTTAGCSSLTEHRLGSLPPLLVDQTDTNSSDAHQEPEQGISDSRAKACSVQVRFKV